MKKKFLVRKNCEYTLVVLAQSAEEALEKSEKVAKWEWDEAWSPTEVDPDLEA